MVTAPRTLRALLVSLVMTALAATVHADAEPIVVLVSFDGWRWNYGIVSNTMVDPGFSERFTMSAQTAKDPLWWGGEPLWATPSHQGRRTASIFWPGSEAPIGGVRPTYWLPCDYQMPNAARVQQVLDWLALPQGERPSLLTPHFSEVDHAGRQFGPESREVMDAAGPRVRQGLRVARLESVQVYEFVCELQGVNPAKNDGKKRATAPEQP